MIWCPNINDSPGIRITDKKPVIKKEPVNKAKTIVPKKPKIHAICFSYKYKLLKIKPKFKAVTRCVKYKYRKIAFITLGKDCIKFVTTQKKIGEERIMVPKIGSKCIRLSDGLIRDTAAMVPVPRNQLAYIDININVGNVKSDVEAMKKAGIKALEIALGRGIINNQKFLQLKKRVRV